MNQDRIRIGGLIAAFLFCVVWTGGIVAGCTAAEQQTAQDIITGACVPVVTAVPVAGGFAVPICVAIEDVVAEVEAYEAAHGGAKLAVPKTAKGEVIVPPEVYAGVQRRAAARMTAAQKSGAAK